jgi:hypothetical protein
MPIRNGSIGFIRARVLAPLPAGWEERTRALEAHQFTPIDPEGTEETSVGWSVLPEGGRLQGDLAGVATFTVQVETLKPSPAQVRSVLTKRRRELEAERQAPLSASATRDLKDLIKRDLRKRVFPRTQLVDLLLTEDDDLPLLVCGGNRKLLQTLQLLWKYTFGTDVDQETAGSLARRLIGDEELRRLAPEVALMGDPTLREPEDGAPVEDEAAGVAGEDPLEAEQEADEDSDEDDDPTDMLTDHRFLGREFLTWLACVSSAEDGFRTEDGWQFVIGDHARLTAFGSSGMREVQARSGNLADMSDLRFAVGGGLLPRELALVAERNERLWTFVLLADGLSFRQVKLPTSLATETDEVTDERARNLLDLDEAVLSTYRHFLVRRADPDAWAGEVANIMAWVRDAVRHA